MLLNMFFLVWPMSEQTESFSWLHIDVLILQLEYVSVIIIIIL